MGKMEKVAPQGDELRIALAECILDRDAKAKATALAREALERSNELVVEAERHADVVRIALASAQGREPSLRQAVEGGGVIEKPASTREQRFAEIDAADEIELARKVLTNCTASLAFAVDAQQWAQRKVDACVTPILAAEVDRVIVETARLNDELHKKHEVLIWLRSQLPAGDDQRKRIGFLLPPPAAPGVREMEYRTPSAWVAAREALMVDAGAPLPA
jgi:hypothetical protein